MFRYAKRHAVIIGSLIMREIVTRFGREGIGFLWLVAEPLLFCLGVMGLWWIIKPEYEHGIHVAAFVMTGYMSILLFRHIVSNANGALQANAGLLYHRRVRPLHIYISRSLMELAGGTMAFIVVYIFLLIIGVVHPPRNYLLLYFGYLALAVVSHGFAVTFAAIAIRFEFMERILPVSMYLMIPLSGAFVMVDWVPQQYQALYLLNPLPHGVEMIRASVFGEFVPTHYSIVYITAWALGLNLLGLVLLARAQRLIDID
ncbi:transport permease protein [Brevundimonas intermedia]|uniref:Transport permease protein n=1 Tax=Brevundimonas intermedia TaxID=74315 RepID=A0ABQ5T963_9CAUL|nr:ABC transporter permease [Brevundimonas intermedia]GLK49345.1 transport permease protein [Brevundimonas intermedia]